MFRVLTAVLLLSSSFALAAENPKPEQAKEAAVDKCEHGVKKSLCTRCNPKLAPVFKAKGDWCGEHSRPESQCAVCKPALEKQGIKP